jgi:hypothetical protein
MADAGDFAARTQATELPSTAAISCRVNSSTYKLISI